MTRVLVCGGRTFCARRALWDALARVRARHRVACIIEGGATGADALAREWAHTNGVPVETYVADWRRYGRSAGPRRNAAMLRDGRSDLVVACPGGLGTADMVRRAVAAGVPVILVNADADDDANALDGKMGGPLDS